ncbi:hypothetical protein J8K86_01575 [Bacteroides fragilis]|uniref:hypothetical protein n=1 Tax=Bacteroides fragilis TaxID=817 RepID=UPI00202E0336|nr:hypothetical protein [Bacteroides fragilis]MCM0340493.1 hypothetical protein [Bacteroides fragilis]
MDNKACKGQISRIFASLFPNYGRKSYDYGEISTLLWGEQPANTWWKCLVNHRKIAIQWADTQFLLEDVVPIRGQQVVFSFNENGTV